MKDIFFYWSGIEPLATFTDVKKYFPSAKFIELNTNPVVTARDIAKRSLTKQYWLLDIDLAISDELKQFIVPEWDQEYVHVFNNDILSAYLIPKTYQYTDTELATGIFSNKKVEETLNVYVRPHDIYFYWSGLQPALGFDNVKKYFPTAKFIELKNNVVETASIISKETTTSLFWLLDIDLLISKDLQQFIVPKHDQQYAYVFNNELLSAYLIPKTYQYTDDDLAVGIFSSKKVEETDQIYQRPLELYFYWTGVEPKHKFEGVRRIYPDAKFVKHQKNPVNTARIVSANVATSRFWLIDIELVTSGIPLSKNIPKYDQKYVHAFSSDALTSYLVPTTYSYNAEELLIGHFANKTVIEYSGNTYRPYDIFFLSYDEETADANFEILVNQYPWAKRIHGIKGIFNAHLKAAEDSTTDFFWVVDADAIVKDTFKFDYRVPPWDFDVVHIWNSRNSVNRLEYGYGGIKLIPKFILLMRANTSSVDVTTSIGSKIKYFNEVSNINEFATSPFNAWRAGFREGVKLSSAVISRQNTEESKTRLEVWCSVNVNHPLGDYVKAGAKLGKGYGTKNQQDLSLLALINDYDWLNEKFEQYLELRQLNQMPSERLQ